MELRQLEYFVAVAEERSFTRAAERMHISQSGVSAQIRQLEQDLGATLIDRSARSATVTAAGSAALEHARIILASVDDLGQAVDEVAGLIRGRLVVGMVSGCTLSGLFDALAAFHLAHAGVEITLLEDNSERLIEHVQTNGADLALIGTVGSPPSDLDSLPFASERLVVAVPLDHPLAKRKRTTLAAVSEYPIVCMPVGTAPRTMMDQASAAQQIPLEIVLQASAPAAVADLAFRSFGIAILTESMAALHVGRLTSLVIDDIKSPAGLALVWKTTRTTTSPALREFLVFGREALSTGG